MTSRATSLVVTFAGAAALAGACSATTERTFETGPSGSTSGPGAGGANGSSGPSSAAGLGGAFTTGASTGSGQGGGDTVVCNAGMNEDKDKDGWTIAQGDCNDCDPNVNPGAIDTPAHAGPDGGIIPAKDNNCDGKIQVNVTCDANLALDDVTPMDGAKAIELCQTTTLTPATPEERTWGVLSANYVRANGTVYTPGNEVGILQGFGPNVHVQGGKSMLVLSSGHARIPGQVGACNAISCSNNGAGVAPAGFPQNVPNCTPDTAIADDEGLELQIRAPTNATGYGFAFKFHSFEYPTWVCTSYNDQFIGLVSPAPAGAINGNIIFDANKNPVSVNLAFFEVCDPTSLPNFASSCVYQGNPNCPAKPNPYCPSGLAQLEGTGFDVWGGGTNKNGGATTWLQTAAPVAGGSVFTIRLAIWDTGNIQYDSTVLIDDFNWVATGGTVAVGTMPIPIPQ